MLKPVIVHKTIVRMFDANSAKQFHDSTSSPSTIIEREPTPIAGEVVIHPGDGTATPTPQTTTIKPATMTTTYVAKSTKSSQAVTTQQVTTQTSTAQSTSVPKLSTVTYTDTTTHLKTTTSSTASSSPSTSERVSKVTDSTTFALTSTTEYNAQTEEHTTVTVEPPTTLNELQSSVLTTSLPTTALSGTGIFLNVIRLFLNVD